MKVEKPTQKEVILFWGTDGEHGIYSNFFPRMFTLNRRRWKSVEHYYQAAKTKDPSEAVKIRRCKNAAVAKRLGKAVKLRNDWDSVKVSVMEEAVYAKFSQHEDLKKRLLDTGDSIIHEDSPYDFIWGWGKGKGQDLLGKVLMKVRDRLREEDEARRQRA